MNRAAHRTRVLHRLPYANTPANQLPHHVCPHCRVEQPVDRMPHRTCPPWDDTPGDNGGE